MLKKVTGLALVLLAGLTVAYGGVTGLVWEMLGGLILMVLGVGPMALNILHRNSFQTGRR